MFLLINYIRLDYPIIFLLVKSFPFFMIKKKMKENISLDQNNKNILTSSEIEEKLNEMISTKPRLVKLINFVKKILNYFNIE